MLQVKASPLHDAAGQFLGASAVFEDITERLEAEARERSSRPNCTTPRNWRASAAWPAGSPMT